MYFVLQTIICIDLETGRSLRGEQAGLSSSSPVTRPAAGAPAQPAATLSPPAAAPAGAPCCSILEPGSDSASWSPPCPALLSRGQRSRTHWRSEVDGGWAAFIIVLITYVFHSAIIRKTSSLCACLCGCHVLVKRVILAPATALAAMLWTSWIAVRRKHYPVGRGFLQICNILAVSLLPCNRRGQHRAFRKSKKISEKLY